MIGISKTRQPSYRAVERRENTMRRKGIEFGVTAAFWLAIGGLFLSGCGNQEPQQPVIAERTEAPALYQTSLETETLQLTAEAVVTAPGEEQVTGVYSTDGDFYLSFWDGEEEGATPIVWLTENSAAAAGSIDDFSQWEKDRSAGTDRARTETEATLREKSEEFIEKVGGTEFSLVDAHWVEIIERKENRKEESQPGFSLLYRRTWNGISVLGSRSAAIGETPRSGVQYFRFSYKANGIPVEIMDISREELVEKGDGDAAFHRRPYTDGGAGDAGLAGVPV